MTTQFRRQVQSVELKTTWLMVLVSLCYTVFVAPITIMTYADPEGDNTALSLLFYCVYWIQYSFNFFLYALRSQQYRDAYADYLSKSWGNVRFKMS